MDFKELAKIAAANKKSSTSTPEEQIERLKRSVAREKEARKQAEKTIEESSRRLYLANQEAAALNKELESTLQDLNETLGALTSAKAKRIATIVTLVLATILFFVTEFVEPILEEKIDSGLMLIVAKGMIFATLIPIEIIGSRLAERNLTESGKINDRIYRDLLISAYRTASSLIWSEIFSSLLLVNLVSTNPVQVLLKRNLPRVLIDLELDEALI